MFSGSARERDRLSLVNLGAGHISLPDAAATGSVRILRLWRDATSDTVGSCTVQDPTVSEVASRHKRKILTLPVAAASGSEMCPAPRLTSDNRSRSRADPENIRAGPTTQLHRSDQRM